MSSIAPEIVSEEILESECKCEAPHRRPIKKNCIPLPECSVVVTHMCTVSCIGQNRLSCRNVASHYEYCMGNGVLCMWCDRLCEDCWSVRPV